MDPLARSVALAVVSVSLLVAVGFSVAACSSRQGESAGHEPDPVAVGAETDRHCRLAMTFAESGRCLEAGEQLAHCSGHLSRSARTKAAEACPPAAQHERPSPVSPSPAYPSPAPHHPAPHHPAPHPSPHPSPPHPQPPHPKAPQPQPPLVIPSALPPVFPLPKMPGTPAPAEPLDHRD